MITHDELLKIVSYDPDTGIFRLLQATARRPTGTILNYNFHSEDTRAATVSAAGLGKFTAGRLAWFYMTKDWPPAEIDHEDNDGWNQRWSNLRLATRSQNQANTRCYRSNKLGRKGVYRREGRFRAMIQKDKRRISLGDFDSEIAASAAYAEAAAQLHGEFARL